eukprot:g6519.t1
MASSEITSSPNDNQEAWKNCPTTVVHNIAVRLRRSPTWKSDALSICLAVPRFRTEFSDYLRCINSRQLSELGLSLYDIVSLAELFSFDFDFTDKVGEIEDLSVLDRLPNLEKLTITNYDTVCARHEFSGSCPFADDVVFSPRKNCLSLHSTFGSLGRFLRCKRSDTTPSSSEFSFLRHLTVLKKLTIDRCDKRLKAIATAVAKNSSLKIFCLRVGQFYCQDIIPLRGLQADLNLTLNGLVSKKSISEIHRLPSLTSLSLKYCKLGSFCFRRIKALKYLRIESTFLTDRDFENIRTIKNPLACLGVKLEDTNAEKLNELCTANLPMTSLAVSMHAFETHRSLGLCTKLESLAVFSTEEQFRGDALLCLETLTRLKRLCIYGCEDWTPILSLASVFGSHLTSVKIGWSNTEGEMLSNLPNLGFLRELTLHTCTVLNDLSTLKDFNSLEKLSIGICPKIEQSLCEMLPKYLPKTLTQLKLQFSDDSEIDGHIDLISTLHTSFPHMKVLLENVDLW